MKCSRCKLESDIPEAFTLRKRWFGLLKRTYCPVCWEVVSGRDQVVEMAGLIAVLITLDVLLYQRGMGFMVLDILLMALIYILLVAVHELAHAVAGTLLGVRVFAVKFGFGRNVFSRRLFGIKWEFREWPSGGSTVMAGPPQRGSRARLFGAILAGPAVHGLLLITAVALQIFLLFLQGWFGVDARIPLHAANLFFYFNLILLIFNLIPMKAGLSSGMGGTDGWHLLDVALMKPAAAEQLIQNYYLLEIQDALARDDTAAAQRFVEEAQARYPDIQAFRVFQGNVLLAQKRFSEARDIYCGMLSGKESEWPLQRRILFNNIAYADVLLRKPDLLPEADRYSEEAYQQMGWNLNAISTRGAVLVETGRLEEGIRMLKQAMAKRKEPVEKASDAYHLALAENRRGNLKESRRYYQLIRKYDPKYFLLDSLAQEIQIT